ncbi:MlaD family protein [Antrihabitans stalactiti]|uniref:MCE family protein n=1 Tax=Antrihabitans stalactiti TaxID=2584121 RepID=A0A848KD93_9NOCA|nr:MCE family protein [Antrihabitans stalactiti]NMN95528.1 MCE family protein [Antrihabitans stalactiti]
MRGRSQLGLVVRLVVFTALIGALLAGIVIAIQRPVEGSTRTFEAMFTDASGLRTNADVRMFGVAVGKVTAIDLDNNQARVRFTVVDDRPVYQTSKVAIRYQNLTGQRYVDIQQPGSPGTSLEPDTLIGTDRTIPSFDITALFNGMEPVLAEFSPEAVNQFLQNAIAVIEGDGKAVGSTLDAIDKLSSFVSNRQQVVSVLLRNFEQVYEQLGGKSPETATLIQGISDVFVNLQKQFEGLMDFVDAAPSVLGPLNNLFAALGFTQPDNPDLQNDIRLLFPDPDTAIDLLNKLPGLLQSLTNLMPDPNNPVNRTCANGSAEVPGIVAVLIAGQRISICNG